jgi:hypothetical protein
LAICRSLAKPFAQQIAAFHRYEVYPLPGNGFGEQSLAGGGTIKQEALAGRSRGGGRFRVLSGSSIPEVSCVIA